MRELSREAHQQHQLGKPQILSVGAFFIAVVHGIRVILKVRSAKMWNQRCLTVGYGPIRGVLAPAWLSLQPQPEPLPQAAQEEELRQQACDNACSAERPAQRREPGCTEVAKQPRIRVRDE